VITSCGGTFNVTVRRSTFTMRSTDGNEDEQPGPFGSGKSLPSLKMTPRSYSRATLTVADSRIRSTTTMTTTAPSTIDTVTFLPLR